MWSGGGQVGITGTSKNSKMSVGRMSTVESKKQCEATEGRSGMTIKEIGGSK